MSRFTRPTRISLAATLVATLIPAGTAVAQSDATASPSAGVEVSAQPAESLAVPHLTWTEVVDLPGGTEGVTVAGVTSVPGGPNVLYGNHQRSTRDGGFREQPRLWVSEDGADWQSASLKGAGRVRSVTGGPAGFVALADRDDQVWHSTDGAKWVAFKLPKDARGRLYDVIGTSDGYLMVGGVGERAKSEQKGVFTTVYRPTVWSSEDGRAWTATGISGHFGTIDGLASAPDGTIVAIGSAAATRNAFPAPMGWRREPDGSWTEVAAPEGWVVAQEMEHGAGRYMAPFLGPNGRGVVLSVDGSVWDPSPLLGPSGAAFVPTPDGVLAIGVRPPFVALTTDWATWTDAALEGVDTTAFPLHQGIADHLDDGRIVLVTEEVASAKKETRRSRIWLGTPTP